MVMVVTVHSVKSMKGSGDIAPLILNPYTILRRADSYSRCAPYLRRNNYGAVILMIYMT